MDQVKSSNFPLLRDKMAKLPSKTFQVSTPRLQERDNKVIRELHEPRSFLSSLGQAALGLIEIGLVARDRENLKPILAFNELTNNGLSTYLKKERHNRATK